MQAELTVPIDEMKVSESRMLGNRQVRFGGGPEEKGGKTVTRLRPTQLQYKSDV